MERAAARDTVDGDDGADRDQYGGEAKRCREPDGVVTVVSVQGFGSEAVALVEAEADDRIPRFLAHLYQDWRSFCGFGRFSGSGMPVTC